MEVPIVDFPRPLRLRFVLLPSEEPQTELAPSSAELRDLFDVVHTTTSAVAEAEGEDLIDALELSHGERLDAKKKLGLARNEAVLAYATEVVDVRRGSFIVEVLVDPERLIQAAAIIVGWAGRRGLDHAWDRMRGGQRLPAFVQGMFGRAREAVEHSVSVRSVRGGRRTVDVTQVVETTGSQGEPVIEVTAMRISAASEADVRAVKELLRDLRIFDE